MDNAAPVTLAMMAELKDVLAIGVSAHADCAALHRQLADASQKAATLALDVQAETNALNASLGNAVSTLGNASAS